MVIIFTGAVATVTVAFASIPREGNAKFQLQVYENKCQFFSLLNSQILSTANSPKERQQNLLIQQSQSKFIRYLLQRGRITPCQRFGNVPERGSQEGRFGVLGSSGIRWFFKARN